MSWTSVRAMLPLWYLVLGWLFSIAAIVGNVFVVYLITTKRSLHTATNWFVLSLAVADVCVGSSWFATDYLCSSLSCDYLLRYTVVSFLYGVSVTNLSVMTLDRYLAVVRPLRYVTFMSSRKVVALISAAWLTVFVPHVIFFLVAGIWTTTEHSNSDVGKFMLFDFVVFESLPLVLLPLATVHIFLIARRHMRQTATLEAQLSFNRTLNRRIVRARRANRYVSSARMMVAAVGAFVVCYSFEVYYSAVYQLYGKDTNWSLLYLNSLLYLVNSAANPVAYALFKKDLRRNLAGLHCCCPRNSSPNQPKPLTDTLATDRANNRWNQMSCVFRSLMSSQIEALGQFILSFNTVGFTMGILRRQACYNTTDPQSNIDFCCWRVFFLFFFFRIFFFPILRRANFFANSYQGNVTSLVDEWMRACCVFTFERFEKGTRFKRLKVEGYPGYAVSQCHNRCLISAKPPLSTSRMIF